MRNPLVLLSLASTVCVSSYSYFASLPRRSGRHYHHYYPTTVIIPSLALVNLIGTRIRVSSGWRTTTIVSTTKTTLSLLQSSSSGPRGSEFSSSPSSLYVVGANSFWKSNSFFSTRHHRQQGQQQQKPGFPRSSNTIATMSTSDTTEETDITAKVTALSEDPYIWLEDVESEESLEFAKESNDKCLAALGNPETSSTTNTYARVLAVLESTDRIPGVSQYGYDDTTGEPVLMNFWKDQQNPKGLWRRTTLESYRTAAPTWDTILDVDELAKHDNISWVWKGSTALPRSRDSVSSKQVTRSLLQLSRGGSDAVHIKEFDLLSKSFVTDQPFIVPEGKTRISYKSRDVVLIGTNFGPGSLTDSGYPRTVREWIRATPLDDATTVHEGEATDVAVGMYIADERIWGGSIYEIKYRSITFYTSKYWIRPIQPEHLLAPNDPKRQGIPDPPEFVPVPIQEDAEISFVGQMIFITLRSDWNPTAKETDTVYKKGSVIYTNLDQFISEGSTACDYKVLFAPTERTAYSYFTATKNYLLVSTMDNVKEKLEFYKILDNGSALQLLPGATEASIRSCSCSPVDPYSGSDEFWFTTDDYTTPSTLYLADASKVETPDYATTTASTEFEDPFITEKLKSLPAQYNSSNLIAEQRFATSKDGTPIPYFMIRSKDIVLNGKNPTLLYGYGGFEVSLGPKYIATAGLAWLERGGVYIEANIRGGGEFGPAWHQAALKANRNKAYEDFIAVAEHLIGANICTPKTLAIRGGSNGGLLMGNMYIMRPDLFGAIHCAVPLLDMKRYHTLLAGASWMAEYGNPDTEDWEFLQKYSPYHNIDPNANYPPILVTTSTRDDRVHPAHARKFVKKLWDIGEGKWTVHYYENIEGGHGGAADAKQSAFMTALAYDFMFDTVSKSD